VEIIHPERLREWQRLSHKTDRLGMLGRAHVVGSALHERVRLRPRVAAALDELERPADVRVRRVALADEPEATRDLHRHLGSVLWVPAGTELLEALLEQVDAGPVGRVARVACVDEEPHAIRVVGPELQRRAVEVRRGRIGRDGEGTIARRPQCETRTLDQSRVFSPRRARVLQSA
jgi:hypothetical protein